MFSLQTKDTIPVFLITLFTYRLIVTLLLPSPLPLRTSECPQTTKYWVRQDDLLGICMDIVKQLPVLVFGKSGRICDDVKSLDAADLVKLRQVRRCPSRSVGEFNSNRGFFAF